MRLHSQIVTSALVSTLLIVERGERRGTTRQTHSLGMSILVACLPQPPGERAECLGPPENMLVLRSDKTYSKRGNEGPTENVLRFRRRDKIYVSGYSVYPHVIIHESISAMF